MASTALLPYFQANRYILPANSSKIIGSSWDVYKQYTKLDTQNNAYVFDATALLAQSEQAAGDAPGGTLKGAYNATFPKDSNKGISVTDNVSKINLGLRPQFATLPADQKGEHIIYPLVESNAQLVYSFKYDGIKEDILIPNFTNDELSFSFDLQLPNGLEARLEKTGDIGVYSADSSLYGNVSYGNDQDKALIEKAKANSQKTSRVFTIPAPIIKDANGTSYTNNASFSLNGNTLTIKATQLKSLAYPISIDPTITVTSAGEFARANVDGNITRDTTNGLVTRGPLTGGRISSWTTENSITNGRSASAVTVYNNYIYMLGGTGSSIYDDIQYASINSSTGAISSTFSSLGQMPAAPEGSDVGSTSIRRGLYAQAYNGYLYLFGGIDLATNPRLASFYAPIKTNGTLGAWTQATSLTAASYYGTSFLYNNRLYAVSSIMQFADIHADGSLGTWSTTSTADANPFGKGVTEYQGVVYSAGSYQTNCCGLLTKSTTIYAGRINATTGQIGTFTSIGTMPNGVFGADAMMAHDGYMYVAGGCAGNAFNYNGFYFENDCSSISNSTYYAEIRANGTLGAWSTTANISASLMWLDSAQSDGHLYIIGGCGNGNNDMNTGACAAGVYVTTVQRADFTPAGDIQAPFTDDAVTTSRSEAGAAVFNGNLYVIAGCTSTGNDCTTSTNTVYRAAIGTDGTIGAYTNTSVAVLPDSRGRLAVTVFNNAIYVVGGCLTATACASVGTGYFATPAASGNIASWTALTANLATTRNNLNLVAHNGFLYAIGGYNGGGATTSVEKGTIAATGNVSAWTTVSIAALGNARTGAASVVYGNRIYVTGGRSGATIYNSIEWADLDASGNIATWNLDNTNPFTTSRFGHTAQVINGYLYIIGGNNNTNDLNDVQLAAIDSVGGTVGAFTTSALTVTTRSYTAAAISAGTIYIVAGCTNYDEANSRCSTNTTATETIAVNNGGQGLSNATTQDSDKLAQRAQQVTLALNGVIYVIGGASFATNTPTLITGATTVQYTTIANDGQVGAWSNATNLPNSRRLASGFVDNGRLYIVGGCSNAACTTFDRSAQYVTPAAGGNITAAWTTQANAIPADWYSFDLATYNGYVYRVGGNVAASRTAATQYASIEAAGGIGTTTAWTTEDSISNAVSDNQVVAYNGYLYSLGGQTASGQLNTVEYTPIDSSLHTISPWTQTSAFNVGRYGFYAEAYNGFMMIAGGIGSIAGSTTTLQDTQTATITASGTLSLWASSRSLFQAAEYPEGAIYNGTFYVTGGFDSSGNSYDDLEYLPISTQLREGTLSWIFDFDTDVRPDVLVTHGFASPTYGQYLTVVYGMGPNATATFGGITQAANLGLNGPNKLNLVRATSVSVARYLYVQLTIGNSPQSVVYPDAAPTQVTDFSIYYAANAKRQLRNGRTFTSNRNSLYGKTDLNRGLDTNPNP